MSRTSAPALWIAFYGLAIVGVWLFLSRAGTVFSIALTLLLARRAASHLLAISARRSRGTVVGEMRRIHGISILCFAALTAAWWQFERHSVLALGVCLIGAVSSATTLLLLALGAERA